MKESGWRITLNCRSEMGERCHHSWTPSWDQLIQYFGQDFDLVADRALFNRLVCEACGQRGTSVIVHPPDFIEHRGRSGHTHHPEPLSVEEATRQYHEREAERRRLGIKQCRASWRKPRAAKAAERAERRSETFIGPPNPWAHRKRGRWL